MKLYDVKLLTITCEILAQKNVIEILKNHDITGYTTYEVEGNGAKGLRGQGFKNEKNVKVEVVMREEKLSGVVEDISRTLFPDFAIIYLFLYKYINIKVSQRMILIFFIF